MTVCKHAPLAHASGSSRRGGFTLIELLVVIALIAMLATLTIAFLPNAASSEREARAAVELQGWLNIAKQKALRDQAPRGLRLWVVAPPGAVVIGITPILGGVTDCQYIEQPDDFGPPGSLVQSALPNNSPAAMQAYANHGYTPTNCLQFNGADLTNGFAPQVGTTIPNGTDPNEKFWTVQPGDYIEINGGGLVYQIVQIGVPNNPAGDPAHGNSAFVKIYPPAPLPVGATTNYRIIRAPRPVGEEPLKLPEGTLIDLGTNAAHGNPLPWSDPNRTFVDILFSPSGQVISRGVTTDKINLWVRAPSNEAIHAADEFRGAPTIVSVFVNTGFVGAYPPAIQPANPYSLIR
jgi:prepilin-type N-terminal cleavage/methylation domain-containing protein